MQTVFTREMSSELFLVMQENGLNMQDVLIPEGIEEIAPGLISQMIRQMRKEK